MLIENIKINEYYLIMTELLMIESGKIENLIDKVHIHIQIDLFTKVSEKIEKKIESEP
jgi:hypothetical protein